MSRHYRLRPTDPSTATSGEALEIAARRADHLAWQYAVERKVLSGFLWFSHWEHVRYTADPSPESFRQIVIEDLAAQRAESRRGLTPTRYAEALITCTPVKCEDGTIRWHEDIHVEVRQ